ncbi:ABC transporter permease [Halobaculum sp. D14]|uniref:ABC transporter permease n=1 Tax=unclassified Halobaculum TaxID=2640896 RepID=UPI003EB81347
MNPSRLGAGTLTAAVVTVQVAAFGVAAAAGVQTLYVPFALLSAVALGVRADEGWFGVASAALGTVLLLALGVPLLAFAFRLNPDLVAEAARSPAVHRMLLLTIYGPLVAAGGAVLFGVPLSYLLSNGFRGQSVVESLVDLPLVVPHSVAGLLVLFGFGEGGVFPSVTVLTTLAGMVLALGFVSAPYAVHSAREAFDAVDDDLRRAARSQGASPFETFRRVTLPLAGRGVLVGGVLAWARGVSEFGAVAVVAYTVYAYVPGVGSVAAQHAPVFIFNTYRSEGLAAAGGVAAVLLAVCAAMFLLVRWLTAGGDAGGVV